MLPIKLTKTLCALVFVSPLVLADEADVTLPPVIEISPAIQARAAAAKEAMVIAPEISQRIAEVAKTTQTEAWHAKQENYLKTIQTALDLPPQPAEATPTESPDRVVLFISSSIPIATLRRYAEDLETINGVMVLRGMIGGMTEVQATLSFMSEVLRIDPTCEGLACAHRGTAVLIDPLLFRDLQIQEVPAMTYKKAFQMQSYCERPPALETVPGTVIYGDAAIDGLLREFAVQNPGFNPSPLIAKLSGASQ